MTIEGDLDSIKGSPFAVEDVNGFGGTAEAPAGVLKDLLFRGSSKPVAAEVSPSGDVGAASTTVAVEGPEPTLKTVAPRAIKGGKKWVPPQPAGGAGRGTSGSLGSTWRSSEIHSHG